MTAPLVRMENVTVRFRGAQVVHAVNGVSLTLEAGQVLGILGESGSGKSVTLKTLLRLLPESRTDIGGAVEVDGRDVLALNPQELADYRGAVTSMIFQDPALALDPAGSRLVTGGADSDLYLWDFAGMTRELKPFRHVEEPLGGYQLRSIDFSPGGDRIIVCGASSQPAIFDRDGRKLATLMKGDMYIRQMDKTRGHVAACTQVRWHVRDKETVTKVRQFHNILGGVIDPHAAYMVMRGIKTLQLRVERHNENAMKLATVLEKHPMIEKVHYPGLPSHPDHEVAKKYMNGFGCVVSFEVKGDLWATAKFIDNCRLPYIAPSLGGVESLIEQPTVVSYWDQGPEKRAAIGIKDNLVRMACGIEDYADIEADIIQALDSIKNGVEAPAKATSA